MDDLTRMITLERGGINLETGEFPMILATEGEAMDGHILSIKGMELPERMPLLFGHRSEIMAPSLGSVSNLRRAKVDGIAVIRGDGRVNIEGEDPLADIRRGVLHLMHSGDLPSVSIRWHPIKTVPRSSLPDGHAAKPGKSSSEEAQFGAFFEKSRALEGSVVAVGADPKALIGRADVSESELERAFWRTLARLEEPESEEMASLGEAFKELVEASTHLRDLGAVDSDIANLLLQGADQSAELVPVDYGAGLRVHIPREAYSQIERDVRLLRDIELDDMDAPKGESEKEEGREVDPKERTLAEMPREEFLQGLAQRCAATLGAELQSRMDGLVKDLTGRG